MKLDVKLEVTEDKQDADEFTMSTCADAVCRIWQINRTNLTNKIRQSWVTKPRFAFMYLSYYMTKNSTPIIGKFLGRDHTTILHGLRRAIELKRTDEEFAHNLEKAYRLARFYEKKRQRKIEALRNEITETIGRHIEKGELEAAIDRRVARKGYLRGDKVIFNSIYPE